MSDHDKQDQQEGTVSRRQFLKIAGITGVTIGAAGGLGGLLAACGSAATTTTAGGATTTAGGATTTAAGPTTTVASAQKMSELYPEIAYGPVAGKKLDDYRFGFSFGGNHAYANPCPGAHNLAAKELGIPELVVQTPQNWVQNEQNQKLDGMIASGIKGIYMMPSEAAAGNAQIAKMVAAGIPVVCMGGPPTLPSKATLTLATDVKKSAYDGTVYLCEALGGKGNIIAQSGMINDTNTTMRFEGVEEAVAKYPNIKLVQKIADTEDPEKSMTALGDVLAARGKEIDGIVNTAYYVSIATAFYVQKPEYAHIKAVLLDTDEKVMDAVRAGAVVGTMSQNPWGQAYICTYTLKMLIDGWKYKDGQPEVVDSGSYLITKENVEKAQDTAVAWTHDTMKTWSQRFDPPTT